MLLITCKTDQPQQNRTSLNLCMNSTQVLSRSHDFLHYKRIKNHSQRILLWKKRPKEIICRWRRRWRWWYVEGWVAPTGLNSWLKPNSVKSMKLRRRRRLNSLKLQRTNYIHGRIPNTFAFHPETLPCPSQRNLIIIFIQGHFTHSVSKNMLSISHF